jgi:hypothetical protein
MEMNFQKPLPVKVTNLVATHTLVEKQAHSHEANVPVQNLSMVDFTAESKKLEILYGPDVILLIK